ncbi:MAG: LytR family transcriptional regulator, partial [Mycobacterium sp.]
MSDDGMGDAAAAPGRPLTVAELIARLNSDPPSPHPRRDRTQPGHAPEPYPEPDDLADHDTAVLPVVAGPRSELPNLAGSRVSHRRAPRHHRQPKRRGVLVGRSAAALIAVLALMLTGSAWQWQSSKNNLLNRVSALDPNSRDIVDPNAQFGDENFLIVGVDSRFGENMQMGVGSTDEVEGSRSDTVMLVNIPANRERVVAVSFPRDLEISPMRC